MTWIGALAALAAAGGPDAAALRRDLDRWDALIEAHGRYPIHWTDAEIAQLATGDVVKRRSKLDGADRVLGAIWSPTGLAETWTAVQDEWHWGHVDGLIEERLPGSTFQDKLLYQRIDAPWPFKDRQWVIRVVNSLDLWRASGEQVIERTWDLDPARGASAEVEDGVWIGVNEGGWMVAPAAGGTVIVYHVRAVVGGSIPDDAASTWTMMTLGGMMRGLVDAARSSRQHYVGDHPRIYWPDHEAIPPFG